MSKYSDEAKIVDESTSIRLQELEVEKARIQSKSQNLTHYVEILRNFTIGLSIAGTILGISWFIYDYNVIEDVESSKQKQAQVEIERVRADSKRDLAQLHVDKLRQVAEIVRNSKSDEIALQALTEVQQ